MTIQTIISSTKLSDIFPNQSDWKRSFNEYVMLCHPDKNNSNEAKTAYQILMSYKDILENGIKFSDEISEITFKDNTLTFVGDRVKLKLSYDNYNSILNSPNVPDHFHRYLPERMELGDGQLKVYLRERAILLHDLTLEEKHVKWALNRLLEFSSISNLIANWCHIGLNPNSVMICPESHGIQIVSFYHSRPINSKLTSAIGIHPYKSWYPSDMFAHKTASFDIDLLMSKRTAMYLLGDRTGFGTTLRGKISDDFLSFLMSVENDIRDGYLQYQEFLNKSPREFHILNI